MNPAPWTSVDIGRPRLFTLFLQVYSTLVHVSGYDIQSSFGLFAGADVSVDVLEGSAASALPRFSPAAAEEAMLDSESDSTCSETGLDTVGRAWKTASFKAS